MTAETETDNQKYRVNLICSCQADAAFGYGAAPVMTNTIKLRFSIYEVDNSDAYRPWPLCFRTALRIEGAKA